MKRVTKVQCYIKKQGIALEDMSISQEMGGGVLYTISKNCDLSEGDNVITENNKNY